MSVKKAINYIADNIKLDYLQQFEKSFKDEDQLKSYKNNLLEKLRDMDARDIVTAYNNYVLSANPFLPTLPNLIVFINSAQKTRLKQEQNYAEISHIAAIPAPKITQGDPIKLLSSAKYSDTEYTPEERKIKHQQNLAKHQANLTAASHRIKRIYADESHLCEMPGCNKAGSISNATHGNGNFYCSLHWRMV